MTKARFKSCANCQQKRAWFLQECPQCSETDFEIIVENGGELVENAIGDSVREPLLFQDEVSAEDLSGDNVFAEIENVLSTILSTEKSIRILNNPIGDYFHPGEQPHFVLKTGKPIRRQREDEVSELSTSSDFDAARIVITDERTLLLIGQNHGDVVKSVAHSEITGIDSSEGLFRTSLTIRSENVTYEISDCLPIDEVKPVRAYISAQAEGGQPNWENDFNYEKGPTITERIRNVLGDVDADRVLNSGFIGAKFGSRYGPKGSALAFIIGVGFAIWRDISGADSSSPETPDPEKFAKTVKEWQQSGAQTGDERVEWLSASIGATIAIAAQNSDLQSVKQLESINPESIVKALHSNAEKMGAAGDLIPANVDTDALPEINHLRQPITELTAIAAGLFEEGLFEELMDADKDPS